MPGPASGPNFLAFAQLTFWDLAASGFSRIHLQAVDRGTGRDVYEPAVDIDRFPISVIADEEYAITFPDQATRDLAVEYRFSQPGRFALISIDYAAPAPDQVFVNFVLVPEAGSLDELKQSAGDTYFYDDNAETLWIKPVLGGTGTSLLDGTETRVIALSGG